MLRDVQDSDFDEIAILWKDYVEWQKAYPPRAPNREYSAKDLKDIYYKNKKGTQLRDVSTEEMRKSITDMKGWVAEENNKVVAYMQWGYDLKEKMAFSQIFVYDDAYRDTADQLLLHTEKKLKEMNIKDARGHVPKRMHEQDKYSWVKKYADKMTEDEAGNYTYERKLK